jgi:tetratricopeptide (TPR) repeat protein
MPSLRAPISAPTDQASSDEGELFITDDPSSSAIAADDSFGDEPLTADSSGIISLDDNASGIMELPADSEEGFLPPTGSLMDELPPDEHGLDDLPPAAHRAGASVPRMPTGVMDASPYPAPMKPPSPLSPPAPLRPPPLQLRPEDAVVDVNEADDLVRRALQDISAEDVAAAADELLLEPELIHAGPDEVAPPALKGRSAPVIPRENAASKSPLAAAISSAGGPRSGNDIDRLAREAVADANKSLAHKQSDVAATALMQLNDEELDEIREFEVETSSRQRGLSSSSNTGPSPVLQVRDELDSFDDPTLALAPPARSSEVTDERPKRAPAGTHSSLLANRPTTSSSGPHPIVHGEPDSVDEDAPTLFVRPADMLAQGSALSKQAPPSLAKPAHRAVAAPPPVVASDFSDEFDPSSFDLPADVKELLRKGEADVAAFDASLPSLSAPAAPAPLPMVDELDAFAEPSSGDITLRGKLGLQDKAQGFEDDPANQFFPDELEEAEFFIKNDLLDEAKEILTAILEDVPESARAQWMLARIEAKERGEAEPPAPWEQRILEEVQAQLDDLGLLDDPHTKQMEARDGTSPQISVEEVLSQFKKGVAETVPEEDAATHYELGIAYREMGLHDDAVNEFLIAARAPTRAADARYMIGNVRKEQGKLDEAVTAFEEAAAQTSASKTQKGAADYERGVLLEELGRDKEALWALKAAKQNGHAAPDLDRRISALVARVGDSNPPPKGNGSNGNGTNGNGHGKAGDKPAVPRPKNIDYV